ncbi:MAG: hypothetical protein HY017_24510 [Betaproteobacteria bacterium]|nr:hypothetical protein [Betaproteobacteria bacterium]
MTQAPTILLPHAMPCIELAGFMIRGPMCFEKMSYDTATGAVAYRSKMLARLKRKFQLMQVARSPRPTQDWNRQSIQAMTYSGV